ncbi:SRPBCC family protein [Deltaproteobacteria bacterium TL4]
MSSKHQKPGNPPFEERIHQLTDAPLQSAYVAILGAPPQEIFKFISDFERLPKWMPGMNKVVVNNEEAETPGGVGAIRRIYSFGKLTEEVVKAFDPPNFLAYSATDKSLGGMFTQHLGVLLCETEGEQNTRFQWKTYAQPASSRIMRWAGEQVFNFMVETSIKNLRQRFPV